MQPHFGWRSPYRTVDDSRSTGHVRVDFFIEEEIVAGILRDRNPHQLDGIPGGMESTFEKENRPPKEGQPSSSTATCSVQKYSPPAAWHIERECTFHDDWANIVTSRVKLRQPPPLPAIFFNHHVIKTNILTNCELDQSIIRTNLLTKFHEDRTINVAYRVFSNQMWTKDDGQRPITKAHLRNQKSTKKRKVDVEEELYDLESRRITSEIRAWEAKKIYYENKIVQEKEKHELNKTLILKQIDNF
ncbi:hypothetical protein DPMN_168652 [Dreissena polymorpha]|uniref:Uncharacterized protein n=1 Tax=Dreissena polymorpha TaxID=45954 RepID=A0A9D4F277_DREPO|nr:hypothetical protein DPMN_168652 [Dreissena polymorpha]